MAVKSSYAKGIKRSERAEAISAPLLVSLDVKEPPQLYWGEIKSFSKKKPPSIMVVVWQPHYQDRGGF